MADLYRRIRARSSALDPPDPFERLTYLGTSTDPQTGDTVQIYAPNMVVVGDTALPVSQVDYIPNGTEADQRLTVDATVGGVALAAFDPDTTHVLVDFQTDSAMVTLDGSAPTTTNGHQYDVGEREVWPVALATAAKFIRLTSTSAAVHASQLIRS